MRCCFIGHRDCTGIEKEIYAKMKELIDAGVVEFYSGGMGNFDRQCECIAKALGGQICLIAYSMAQIKEGDKKWYDKIFCPLGNKPYEKTDIPNRNRWMVENSDICLCYVRRTGGAMHTHDYAIKLGKEIVYI